MTSITGIIPPIHRRFNEEDAMEQIRNRYTIIRGKIPNQLEALRQDPKFCQFCTDLYAQGYKDWMIISAIYNVMLNCKLREQDIDSRDENQMKHAFQAIAERNFTDVYDTEKFIGDEFDRGLVGFHSAVLSSWGFTPRLAKFSPEVIENFLRNRMRHFDFDLPHKPVFADPTGDWPV